MADKDRLEVHVQWLDGFSKTFSYSGVRKEGFPRRARSEEDGRDWIAEGPPDLLRGDDVLETRDDGVGSVLIPLRNIAYFTVNVVRDNA